MTMQNVERMLTDQPVSPPPEGLVDQIKAEVPDNIEIHPSLSRNAEVIPWHRRRDLRLAVAAVFVVALTAVVSWQLRRQPLVQLQVADSQTALPSGLSEPEEAPPISETTRQSEEWNKIRSRIEGVATADAVRETQKDPRSVGDSGTEVAARPVEVKEDRVLGYPDLEVTDNIGEQAMKRPVESDRDRESNTRAQATEPSGRAAEVGPSDEHHVRAPKQGPAAQTGHQSKPITSGQTTGGVPYVGVNDKLIGQAMERSFEGEVTVTGSGNRGSNRPSSNWRQKWSSGKDGSTSAASRAEYPKAKTQDPSTGGSDEPNDQPYGDVLFREYGVNPFIDTEDDRFSTFGLEVDTGSYNVIRRYLLGGNLPPREAVRLEEIVNAFDYGDEPPDEGDFALSAEGAPSLFADGSRYKIVRFGVTARSVDAAERPAAVLTFVVDVSGSMDRENRLVLVKRALYELLDNLREDDRVGLVIYGSNGEVLLEPSTDHEEIRAAIDRLSAGGSTNAEEGLVLAYQLADRFREKGLINRVILCSDGVANVGRTGPESILQRIKHWADNGIELTTVGFGMGNYNDVLMEQLADTGDGRYAYIDSLDEARRLFAEELSGTLVTIGSEAKAQVEFNPEVVSRYRLLGYENRDVADERFRDPTVDAGEIGAGLTATAVYEVKLKKQDSRTTNRDLATLRVRYRPFGSDEPVEIEDVLRVRDLDRKWEQASPSLRLATLVAEYGELLKRSYWARTGDMNEVLRRARKLAPEFEGDDRVSDWIELVESAAELMNEAGEDDRITD